jgi:hypothetical protein
MTFRATFRVVRRTGRRVIPSCFDKGRKVAFAPKLLRRASPKRMTARTRRPVRGVSLPQPGIFNRCPMRRITIDDQLTTCV